MTDATAKTVAPAKSMSTAKIMPTIAQMRENSLAGVVRREVETLILSGELPAGSRVNENAVALRLGVSRGPVREACRALAGMGLLDLSPIAACSCGNSSATTSRRCTTCAPV